MATKKAAEKKGTAKAGEKTASKTTARAKGEPQKGIMKPMNISPALAKVVGNKPLPRPEVVKKLWEYIKKNNLQDQENRRNINADENLKEVFGGKNTVSMFEMTKLVNRHLS